MNFEKISSLHDDVLTPKVMGNLGEYDQYPERFKPEEKSVFDRLEQFGVDLEVAKESLGKESKDFTWEDYTKLVGEAIKVRYDVVVGSVFDQYALPSSENPENSFRLEKLIEQIEKYGEMGDQCNLNLIKRGGDFKLESNLVLGLEAGANLINSLEDLRMLANYGIKIFGFQYGNSTPLADKNGLTRLGQECAVYLFNNNLITDLAHANFKTRRDIMSLAGDMKKGHLVSYTHGCSEEDILATWKDKVGERALKSEEIESLIKMGGIIGLGVSKPFFSNTRKLAERINELSQLENGISRIAIGTDFGGVPPAFLNEIKSPIDLKILADLLSSDFRMDDESINKIIRSNVKDWIKSAID